MILGYKGFKPGLIATLGDGSYQYQPGEVSRTDKAKCASTGFHYCLDPLDCLNWYPFCTGQDSPCCEEIHGRLFRYR